MCLIEKHNIATLSLFTLRLYAHMNYISLIIESFEVVIPTYAQLSLNEIQNFTTPSLTLVTELVSTKLLALYI